MTRCVKTVSHLREVPASTAPDASRVSVTLRRQGFETAANFARERAWFTSEHSAWMEPDIASAAAQVALALEPFACEREWLADPFPTLARVAVGAVPIGRERSKLAAATSSLTHAIDGPHARPVDIAIAAALTARTDEEVTIAADLALYVLTNMGQGATADALARSLADLSRSDR